MSPGIANEEVDDVEVLSSNRVWIVLIAGMLLMHLGHGGGHGAGGGNAGYGGRHQHSSDAEDQMADEHHDQHHHPSTGSLER